MNTHYFVNYFKFIITKKGNLDRGTLYKSMMMLPIASYSSLKIKFSIQIWDLSLLSAAWGGHRRFQKQYMFCHGSWWVTKWQDSIVENNEEFGLVAGQYRLKLELTWLLLSGWSDFIVQAMLWKQLGDKKFSMVSPSSMPCTLYYWPAWQKAPSCTIMVWIL